MNIILKKDNDKYELEWRYLGKSYTTTHDTHDEALHQIDVNNSHRDVYEAKIKRINDLPDSSGDHWQTMLRAVTKMLDPVYRYNEASFRCATLNSWAKYPKYEVQPITNKIIEL